MKNAIIAVKVGVSNLETDWFTNAWNCLEMYTYACPICAQHVCKLGHSLYTEATAWALLVHYILATDNEVMLYRYREGGRNRERNRRIPRIAPPPPFCTEAKVAKGGRICGTLRYITHRATCFDTPCAQLAH